MSAAPPAAAFVARKSYWRDRLESPKAAAFLKFVLCAPDGCPRSNPTDPEGKKIRSRDYPCRSASVILQRPEAAFALGRALPCVPLLVRRWFALPRSTTLFAPAASPTRSRSV